MKKIMMTLTFMSALASIDMIHASAPAAAAGAGAGAPQRLPLMANAAVKAVAEAKVNQTMKLVKERYASAPLSHNALVDMITVISLTIQFHEYKHSIIMSDMESEQKKIKDFDTTIFEKLRVETEKIMKHSDRFLKGIYVVAIELEDDLISENLREEDVNSRLLEFNMQFRSFLEERLVEIEKLKKSTVKPAGGPALEEDIQEA